MTTKFQIPDASCAHCKATIETAVTGLGDVHSAELDLSTHLLTVEHADSVGDYQLAEVISGAGYTPEPAR